MTEYEPNYGIFSFPYISIKYGKEDIHDPVIPRVLKVSKNKPSL